MYVIMFLISNVYSLQRNRSSLYMLHCIYLSVKVSPECDISLPYSHSRYICYNNYIDISIFVKNIKSNNITICISFDKELINYNGNYILEVKDYIIKFSNVSFSNTFNKVNIERFGNYFYINNN